MNYDAQVSALKAATELDSTEADAYFLIAISMAEERLTRDLDVIGLTVFTTVSSDAGSAFIARPAAARIIKSIYRIDASSSMTPLLRRTDEYIRDFWPRRASTGTPTMYAPYGASLFILAPTPSVAEAIELQIVVRPTAVSSSHQDNWFTTYASNALFYAAMVEMCYWMKNPSAAEKWESKYMAEINTLTRESKRDRRDNQNEPLAPQKQNNFEGSVN